MTRRRLADRRGRPRFEIVGTLWGNVDSTALLRVRDFGRGGALLEAPFALPLGSLHRVTAVADDQPHAVQVRVRHARTGVGEGGRVVQLIGVEFVHPSPEMLRFLDGHIAAAGGGQAVETS